jgi:peptide/nickel transport system substrate-binding protein
MQRRQFLLTAASTIGASIAPGALLPAWAADTTRTLKFIPQADLAILDPIGTTAYVTRNHALMVYDTLFGVDEQYNPHPQMLESAVVENDGKLWRLTLRRACGSMITSLCSVRMWSPVSKDGANATSMVAR